MHHYVQYLSDPVNVSLEILFHLLLGPETLEVSSALGLLLLLGELSAQHTQDQVHHKEGTQHHHRDEVHELPGVALQEDKISRSIFSCA